MAIQIPNPGTGNGATGDNEFVLWSKVKDNFTDQTNAASRLVGTEGNQIPLAQNTFAAAFKRVTDYYDSESFNCNDLARGKRVLVVRGALNSPNIATDDWVISSKGNYVSGDTDQIQIATGYTTPSMAMRIKVVSGWGSWVGFYTTGNVTKDSNGFLKGASPVVDLYNDCIELNDDAKKQPITFEKVSVGNYLVKGSLGFAQEGWYIETPKDANGNVLVAVVYEQLANNDISIKTYAKKFDDETGDIVANLAKPRDIPTGRFISLRLHELPVEIQPEV